MIYGIGTDIVQIARIASALAKNGERFAEKILGAEELDQFHRRMAQVEARGIRYLATRFAAKEAFSKALGTGMQLPMHWHAMQTLNAASGQPELVTNGALHEWLHERRFQARVSLSDEREYAVAFVIIEQS
jgi:holo-[acyl-carrier protein] synthase